MKRLIILLLICVTIPVSACAGSQPAGSAVMNEKRNRTAAQRKIDSQLLYAIYRQRGEAEAKGVPPGELLVRYDAKGRAIVTVRAIVTSSLLARIRKLGGEVISSSKQLNDIRAHVPLENIERLAALKDVRAILRAEEATTNR